jgi:SAM-dependent methyltransferase
MIPVLKILLDFLPMKKIVIKLRKSHTVNKIEYRLSRLLASFGVNPPWKITDSRKYWLSRTMGDEHGPEKYLQEDNATYVLFEDLLRVVGKNTSFLEIGCNAGRNLNFLYNLGYRNLTGIEINELSINKTLKEHFPDLYKVGRFYIGNAADEIKKIPDDSYDVTFSISVLEHIPPEDKSLFFDMARVTRGYIAIITGVNSMQYPYNYDKMFEKFGYKKVLFRLFYGEGHNFEFPKEFYCESKYFFNSMFLSIFIKKEKD